jgi:hypothetical protein
MAEHVDFQGQNFYYSFVVVDDDSLRKPPLECPKFENTKKI